MLELGRWGEWMFPEHVPAQAQRPVGPCFAPDGVLNFLSVQPQLEMNPDNKTQDGSNQANDQRKDQQQGAGRDQNNGAAGKDQSRDNIQQDEKEIGRQGAENTQSEQAGKTSTDATAKNQGTAKDQSTDKSAK